MDGLNTALETLVNTGASSVIISDTGIPGVKVKMSIYEEGEVDALELLSKYKRHVTNASEGIGIDFTYRLNALTEKICGVSFTPEEIKLLREL